MPLTYQPIKMKVWHEIDTTLENFVHKHTSSWVWDESCNIWGEVDTAIDDTLRMFLCAIKLEETNETHI